MGEPDEEVGIHAKKSKLEVCLELLRLFAQDGPMTIAEACKQNPDGKAAKEFKAGIEFLTKQNLLLKTQTGRKRAMYEVTQTGMRVLEYFRLLPSSGDVEEESDEDF